MLGIKFGLHRFWGALCGGRVTSHCIQLLTPHHRGMPKKVKWSFGCEIVFAEG